MFYINTLNYNKNNNIYNTNINVFDKNTLNYKRNNNIYNTHYYIKKTNVRLAVNASRSNMEWGGDAAKPNVGLGADMSRSNVWLGADDSRPNMRLGVDASMANVALDGVTRPYPTWDWSGTCLGPAWRWTWMRPHPTRGWVWTHRASMWDGHEPVSVQLEAGWGRIQAQHGGGRGRPSNVG